METIIQELNQYTDKKFKRYINNTNLSELYKIKAYADDMYYNADITSETPMLTDHQYDLLKETIMQKDANYNMVVGAQLREEDNRVELPFWLGSMDKIKPNEQEKINKWLLENKSTEYIIEDKLDGVSCLLVVNNNTLQLFTRGSGLIGGDISYLAPYISTIPKHKLPNINIRGELIMSCCTFNKKYHGEYKNARNMVSGIVNAKTLRTGLPDVEFIAYEILDDGIMNSPSEQLKILSKLGFHVVRSKLVREISAKILLTTLENFNDTADYAIDGIIVQNNDKYERNTEGNPEYAFAFKSNTSIVQTVVIEVLWNISKWGVLKPRIEIEPVQIGCVTITYTTGFNAKYIMDNNIGPGTVISLVRSGDVIPHIVEINQSSDEPQMPDIPYKWNKTNVDIIIEDYGPEMCIKLMSGFFSKLNIKDIGEKRIKMLHDGGLNSLLKIIGASVERITEIPGFQRKGATKIHKNIHNGLQNVSIPTILGASGIFGMGMGRKRVTSLFDAFPNILTEYKTMSPDKLMSKILEIEGFSEITAQSVVNSISWADKFIEALGKYATFEQPKVINDSMKNWKIVFTGFRDAELEKEIVARGGKLQCNTSKNTNLVVNADKADMSSSKIQKAIQLGIPIIKKEEFIKKYIK